MTVAEFRASLGECAPPEVPPLLVALWHDGRGDWDDAHRIVQEIDDRRAAWVHAYLHRKEGDLGNARYWYRRAQQPEATGALEEEWERIVATLLEVAVLHRES
jgi:hypothetical protein